MEGKKDKRETWDSGKEKKRRREKGERERERGK